MTVGIDFLQATDESLKGETPPGHYRTKKKKVINVESDVQIGPSLVTDGMWKQIAKMVDIILQISTVCVGTVDTHGLATC